MSDEETKIINDPRSFQERVLAELEALDSRLAAIEKRDTETASGLVREFKDLSATFKTCFANLDGKLDVVNSELLQVKVDQRAVEKRVRNIEAENRPQVITQDKGF
jgi:hypothetical protein